MAGRFSPPGKEYKMLDKFKNLLTVKSLVTIILTAVFAYLALTERISQDFMTVYAVVIAFYFGTQHEKTASEASNSNG